MSEHAHAVTDDTIHFRLRTYLTGFLVSLLLTAIPFWIVMARPFTGTLAVVAIVVLAVAQILVHTFAFLHMNARAQGGWVLVAYVFTAVILLIVIGGSLWIMIHLNSNMMPGMMSNPAIPSPAPPP